MCLILEGELRGTREFKSNKGKAIEVLRVLATIGKSERFLEVANFSDSKMKVGPIRLNVVPRVNVSEKSGRGFLNWATFEPAMG